MFSADSYITGDRRPMRRPHQERHGRVTIESYAEHFLATWRLSDSGRAFYRLIIANYLAPAFPGPMAGVTVPRRAHVLPQA
jgi:hypothetical protein